MLILPIQLQGDSGYTLVVILEKDNLDRIQQADPSEFDFTKMGEPWVSLKPRGVMIAYADPVDIEIFKTTLDEKGPMPALKYLGRGFKYRPEMGDHDNPYLRRMKTDEGTDKC